MIAELIAVGTELLLGMVDTNTSQIGRRLAELGIDVFFKSVVGDNPQRLEQSVRLALSRSDLVITSGGLGPTVDDVTRPVLAKVAQRKLVEDIQQLEKLKAFFKDRGREMSPNNLAQAQIPEGAEFLSNANGTAPGLWIACQGEFAGKVLVALPGPPRELLPILEQELVPKLYALSGGVIFTERIFTFGLGESAVDQGIRDIFESSRNPSIAILTHGTHVEVRITAKANSQQDAKKLIQATKAEVLKRLGSYVFSQEGENLEQVVGKLLQKKQATLALAESCTGGLIASRITSVPGSSSYFDLGLVTYANQAKEKLLAVPPAVLKKAGAVSKDCALAMAVGLARIYGRDYNLAVTGIAGPDGGSEEKPVGLVHFALAGPSGVFHQEYHFGRSERAAIQARAAQAGLYLLYCALTGNKPNEKGEDRGVLPKTHAIN